MSNEVTKPASCQTAVSRSAVEPLVETLFMIATAPHPANDFEYNSFVETAKRIAQKALDDFDKHFC